MSSTVDNVIVVSGPDELMDYDHAIAEVTHQFLSSDADADALLLLSLSVCQVLIVLYSCVIIIIFLNFF